MPGRISTTLYSLDLTIKTVNKGNGWEENWFLKTNQAKKNAAPSKGNTSLSLAFLVKIWGSSKGGCLCVTIPAGTLRRRPPASEGAPRGSLPMCGEAESPSLLLSEAAGSQQSKDRNWF